MKCSHFCLPERCIRRVQVTAMQRPNRSAVGARDVLTLASPGVGPVRRMCMFG